MKQIILGLLVLGCLEMNAAVSPRGADLFPAKKKKVAPALPPPLPPGFSASQVTETPLMLGISRSGNNVTTTWLGGPTNVSYALLYKTNVLQTNWITALTTTNRSATFGATNRFRFMKVQALTPVSGQVNWLIKGTNNIQANAFAVASDGAGNTVTVGSFRDSLDFGNGPLISDNSSIDIFVVKHNSAGVAQWSKRIGAGSDDDAAKAVAIDSSGDILVTGNFWGNVNFGGLILTSASDPVHGFAPSIFVAKYSSAGALMWAKAMGGGYSVGRAIAVDSGGNVFVGATFSASSASFANSNFATFGGDDIAMIKFQSGGIQTWAKHFGGPDTDTIVGIAANRSGDLAITGSFSSNAEFGDGNRLAIGNSDIFLCKYNSLDGSAVWVKTLGSFGNDGGYGVAVDTNTGNVVVTGQFAGAINFGSGNVGPGGIFMASYNPAGGLLWTVAPNISTFSVDRGQGACVDGDGNCYFTGQVAAAALFGGSQVLTGPLGTFVASYARAGTYRWALRATGGVGTGIAAGSALTSSGYFTGTMTIGGKSITTTAPFSAPFIMQQTK